MKKNNTLALFDFDGTITRKDTFLAFIRFTHGSLRYWLGMWVLSPLLVLYALKVIPNNRAKVFVFRYFFGGWKYERFKKAGEDFCAAALPALLRKSAIEKIQFHQQHQHRLIVVTASAGEWVHPWCQTMGMEIISTKLEVVDEKITGRLAGTNCYGPEKVNRIQQVLQLQDYPVIYAYGDSNGDKEMLAIAQHSHYKPFID